MSFFFPLCPVVCLPSGATRVTACGRTPVRRSKTAPGAPGVNTAPARAPAAPAFACARASATTPRNYHLCLFFPFFLHLGGTCSGRLFLPPLLLAIHVHPCTGFSSAIFSSRAGVQFQAGTVDGKTVTEKVDEHSIWGRGGGEKPNRNPKVGMLM